MLEQVYFDFEDLCSLLQGNRLRRSLETATKEFAQERAALESTAREENLSLARENTQLRLQMRLQGSYIVYSQKEDSATPLRW